MIVSTVKQSCSDNPEAGSVSGMIGTASYPFNAMTFASAVGRMRLST